MEIYYEIAGAQIDGARELQEDAFLTTFVDVPKMPPQSVSLVIVADGMGGHAAGNIASNLVVSTFNKHFTAGVGAGHPPDLLRECLDLGNGALEASIRETPQLHGMGCTMVAAALVRGKLFWVSVGDSHLYQVRDGAMEQRNEDHSYGGYLDRLRAEGLEPEPEQGLSRHMLMSAVTGEEIAEIDCPEAGAQLLPEDRLILATDGIDTLGPERISSISAGATSPRDCVQMLLNAVEKENKPRQDNTTVVVVDVRERAEGSVRKPQSSNPGMVIERPPNPAAAAGKATSGVPPRPVARRAAAPTKKKGGAAVLAALVVAAAAAGGGWYWWQGQQAEARRAAEIERLRQEQLAEAEAAEAQAGRAALPADTSALTTPETLPSGEREPFSDRLASGVSAPIMVPVPEARFRMGGDSAANQPDEQPSRVVTLPAFAISEAEVTVADYLRFARATGRRVPAGHGGDAATEPVTDVSWRDANAYATWLSGQTGEIYRLPTEAEWEFAASVGRRTVFWWGREAGTNNARCFDCGTQLNPQRPVAVKTFAANPLGLYDTAGNVAEWVSDCYASNYADAPLDGSAVVTSGCIERVVRGGGYRSPSESMRATRRERRPADTREAAIGFRLVRELGAG